MYNIIHRNYSAISNVQAIKYSNYELTWEARLK